MQVEREQGEGAHPVDGDRTLSLAPLCAAAAAGRWEALVPALHAALGAGCPPDEVREALLTLAPFCGFPRALDALAAVRAALPASAPEASAVRPTWPARGRALFDRVYAGHAERVLGNLRAVDAEVAAWVVDDAYGKILARPGIDASLRERIGVVLLVAQGLRNQLSGHVRGALNCGATAADVAAFLDAAAPFLPAQELAFARETLARVAR